MVLEIRRGRGRQGRNIDIFISKHLVPLVFLQPNFHSSLLTKTCLRVALQKDFRECGTKGNGGKACTLAQGRMLHSGSTYLHSV